MPLSTYASQAHLRQGQIRRRTEALTVDTYLERVETSIFHDDFEMQMSPVGIHYTCGGDCPPSSQLASAVCFSACKGGHEAHEDPGGDLFTDAFVKALRKNPIGT